jgi:SHS2 domain-containing protein
MGHYRLLEHTADMGIEASGADLAELFDEAARGLREIVFGEQAEGAAKEERTVELEASEAEELLVSWLSELLFLMSDLGFFPSEFRLLEIDQRHLRGKVLGETDAGHEPVREVKAVTFHLLSIDRQEERWRTRVYVDL